MYYTCKVHKWSKRVKAWENRKAIPGSLPWVWAACLLDQLCPWGPLPFWHEGHEYHPLCSVYMCGEVWSWGHNFGSQALLACDDKKGRVWDPVPVRTHFPWLWLQVPRYTDSSLCIKIDGLASQTQPTPVWIALSISCPLLDTKSNPCRLIVQTLKSYCIAACPHTKLWTCHLC